MVGGTEGQVVAPHQLVREVAGGAPERAGLGRHRVLAHDQRRHRFGHQPEATEAGVAEGRQGVVAIDVVEVGGERAALAALDQRQPADGLAGEPP